MNEIDALYDLLMKCIDAQNEVLHGTCPQCGTYVACSSSAHQLNEYISRTPVN